MVDKKKEAVPGAAVITAISGVMAETHTIPKKGHNKFHGYDYATEEDALRVIRPAMVKAGLVLLPDVEAVSEIDQYGNTHLVVQSSTKEEREDGLKMPIIGKICYIRIVRRIHRRIIFLWYAITA